MARNVRIATIGPKATTVEKGSTPASITETMIAVWKDKIEQVLPDKPDLIVVPEACDRPSNLTMNERLEYYRFRGDRVLEYFQETARSNRCVTIYSAARVQEDRTWRNSSVCIGRDGEIIGTYSKNHVIVEETTLAGILCGNEAPIFDCDFGRVACAICFDLNFDELRETYARERPDLILFSSMYHGGLMQQHWAYSCRSYFVGAICGLPCEIRNPFGEVVASSTNYRDFAIGDINLDYCLAHLDYNREKFTALKRSYGNKVSLHDPGYVGSVLITSYSDTVSAREMAEEMEIELLDDYFARARMHRAANLEPS